jgi:hypothetical protein
MRRVFCDANNRAFGSLPYRTAPLPGFATDLWRLRRSETISGHTGGGSCPTGSIDNTATRTAVRSGKSSPGKSRSRRKPLARALCRCRVRTRFPGARNAARCWHQYPNRSGNAPNATLNFTPAGSVPISILRAASNALNRFLSGSRVRTSAINVRFIPCGFGWKRKHQPRVRRGRWMPERHSRICSRSSVDNRFLLDPLTAASRTRLWLASGWECRDQRLSIG